MNIQDMDKQELKSAIEKIMKEDPSYFKKVIEEILTENDIIVSEEQLKKRKKLEKMINEDFDKYDEVFKSLA